MTTNIMWFRQDLRVNDNLALTNAGKDAQVIPVYIWDTTLSELNKLGAASRWWLHHSLDALNASLNNSLAIFVGDPKEILLRLAKQYDCTGVYWNRMYEPAIISRDTQVKTLLQNNDIVAKSTNSSLLWEPMSVLKNDNTPYKVFTPYYRNGCLSQAEPRYPIERANNQYVKIDSDTSLDSLELLPKIRWDKQIEIQWQVSEDAAKEKLAEFIQTNIEYYDHQRNFPADKGTSLLSPYLRHGQISVNQVWHAVKDAFTPLCDNKAIDVFLSELGWREFSYYLLYYFPNIQTQNYNAKFDRFIWQNKPSLIQAWQHGNTGIPIVDAGMRELWQTGYMHNRVRMVVGSFLVKNLSVDWRIGERWFWDCLLDADSASNAASWQWVAGTGADAAPYFRIFNPILQGEKFDKQGDYVRRFCPELSKLPNKYIHKPWQAPANILAESDIELGKNYPHPIVDLSLSRKAALDAYANIK